MRDRFRAGDPSALGEAYDEHARVLYHYAFRVCGDRAAAEDVVSAAFLEAWRCRGKVHAEGGSLRPWLLGIATNIMRGSAREARRRDAALARMPDRGVLPDFADDVLARMTDGEQIRAARAALGKLRRREREVFTLVVWAGLDYAAAGEALGVPVGTVRSRLSRARERLRKLADAELRTARREERAAAAAVRSPGGAVRPAGRAVGPHGGTVGPHGAPAPGTRPPAASGAEAPRPAADSGAARPASSPRAEGRTAVPGARGRATAPDAVGRADAAPSTVRPALVPRPIPENQA
ncbi:sigma-70 family RNA polymerase sigma factor [Streptomyces sp. NPDC056460]|uniref:RNA polymerase sigma factor n=1 Tax=Streptomyces sp. NPDC056460 TaxID=3345825 RepID=UPI0036A4D5C4